MRKSHQWAALGLSLSFLAMAGPAQTDEKSTPVADAASQAVEEALKSLGERQKALQDEFDQLKEERESDDKKKAVIERYNKLMEEEVPKLFKLAEKAPASEAAYAVFEMVLFRKAEQSGTARELAVKHQLAQPWIASFVQLLGDGRDPADLEVLETIREKNSDRKVLAFATLSLALRHKRLIRTDVEKQDEHFEKAKSLFAEVEERFSDVEPRPGRSIAEIATQIAEDIETFRKISVGKEIPDLAGEDTDGNQFKLSDYRGKVVLLDFWAFW